MPSVPAYEAYLRYRSYQWQFTPEASRRSRECLEQALALDPEFALPYVGLADYHFALATVGRFPSARGDAAGARTDQARARDRSRSPRGPRDARPRQRPIRLRLGRGGAPLPHRGRARAAVAAPAAVVWDVPPVLRRPRRRGAAATRSRDRRGSALPDVAMHAVESARRTSDELDEALADARKAVELDPGFWVGWMDLGVLLAIRGQHDEAMACAERAMAAAPWSPYSLGLMAAALANCRTGGESRGPAGHPAQATRTEDRSDLPSTRWREATHEAAAEWVVKTVEQRFPASIPRVVRQFEPLLRSTAAWPRILQAAKLAPSIS